MKNIHLNQTRVIKMMILKTCMTKVMSHFHQQKNQAKNHHRLQQYQKKNKIKRFISINYDDTDNLIYSASLFETIESLLNDMNQKVKLAAAIAIFIIVRNFKRPMLEKIQISKDNAEKILRNILEGHNNADINIQLLNVFLLMVFVKK